jgi:hypothetical protein
MKERLMSHQHSPVKRNDDVLVIGIKPEAFTPEEMAPMNMSAEQLAAQIERDWAALRAEGVVGEMASVGKDPDEAEAEIRKRFAERSFGVALVGAGVRLLPQHTVLFERIVNVLIDLQPGIRLGFPISPARIRETIQRRLDR